ncbi:hypothetical protein SH2C18_15160 [Clostridium sediminicola]|uniref:Imm32 family immunity protein n=1 Tax=Clostridium sediminicola TaxID=3114879 RepID=UPI0031F1F725
MSKNKYSKIPLYCNEVEEYEINNKNIARLRVFEWNIDVSNQCKVIFNFSKEGLVGLGNYAMRLANEYIEYDHSHIEPLGYSYSTQAMGFFLTPGSPELIFGCEDFGTLNDNGINNAKKLNKSVNFNELKLEYLVDLNFDNDFLESHEIGFCNVAEIKVIKNNIDISKKCRVTLMLSKDALIGIGTQALRLAHNYDKRIKYSIIPSNEENSNSSFGFYLTSDSSSMIVGCKDNKNVFYHDKNFGKW